MDGWFLSPSSVISESCTFLCSLSDSAVLVEGMSLTIRRWWERGRKVKMWSKWWSRCVYSCRFDRSARLCVARFEWQYIYASNNDSNNNAQREREMISWVISSKDEYEREIEGERWSRRWRRSPSNKLSIANISETVYTIRFAYR